MEIPKYARLENERRYLVETPDEIGLGESDFVAIEDLYVTNTRLRLRSVTGVDGSLVYKLCKKYPSNDSFSGAIVNTYLSRQEYVAFTSLRGQRLTKRRYHLRVGEVMFGIDVFAGQLDGLVLCEAEQSTREAVCALTFPLWASREVTEDPFFTGANLAQVTAAQLREKLDS